MQTKELLANRPEADLQKSHPEPMLFPVRQLDRKDIVPLCILTASIVACKIGTLNTLSYWDEWLPGFQESSGCGITV